MKALSRRERAMELYNQIEDAQSRLCKGWKIDITLAPDRVYIRLKHRGSEIHSRDPRRQDLANCILELTDIAEDIQKDIDRENQPKSFLVN